MTLRLLSYALFYFGWFGALYAAKSSYPGTYSFLSLLPLLLVTLWLPQNRPRTVLLVLLLSLAGIAVDSTLVALGYFTFSPGPDLFWPLVPLWVMPIWMGFACSLFDTAAAFSRRPALGAVLGAIGGPLSYAYGQKMEVLRIDGPIWILVVLWFFLFPAFVKALDFFRKDGASGGGKAQV